MIVSPILGIGYIFLTSFWFSWLVSVIKLTVPSFLGIVNKGILYSDLCTWVSTLIFKGLSDTYERHNCQSCTQLSALHSM